SADESAAAKRSKRRAPARTSEREAQAAGNRHDRSLEIEENAVISRLGHESDAARDREVAIHAAGKSVPALIRFARVRLTIKTNAGKESGRTVRLGEAVIDDRVRVLNRAFGVVVANGARGAGSRGGDGGSHFGTDRRRDLADFDLEPRVGLDGDRVVDFLDRVSEAEE